MKIILGSQSRNRRRILGDMGYEFEVMTPDIDEQHRFEDPDTLTLELAREKARALLPRIEGEALLITSDTIASWEGEIREKPVDAEQARQFLRDYQTAPVDAVCSVVVTNTRTGESREGVEHALVHFGAVSDDTIDAIVEDGCVFDCAGGFCIQHPLFAGLIERVDGEVECVWGLPQLLTGRLIENMKDVVAV